ncbi:hypothetical protein FBU30_000240 [Linnemannia zychae]|nr:hypothetical protein FBU30_000240 [Linnemannia zychae]
MPPKRRLPSDPSPPPLREPSIGQSPPPALVTGKRKRNELLISMKAAIIKEYDESTDKGLKVTYSSLANKYKTSVNVMSNIIKDKDAIIKCNDGGVKSKKEYTIAKCMLLKRPYSAGFSSKEMKVLI